MLSDEKVLAIIRRDLEGRFPKTCACCGRVFSTMAEYLRRTTPVGQPTSFDASAGAGQPKARLGTVACANCPCGTTLSVSNGRRGPAVMQEMARWAQAEAPRRGLTVGQLMVELREALERRLLHEDEDEGAGEPSR